MKFYRIAAIASIAFTVAWSSLASGFQAQGTLIVKYVDENTNVTQQQSETFDVSVKDNKWIIVTTPYPRSDQPIIDHWEIGSEGSNEIYQVTFYNNHEIGTNYINDSVGAIEEDVVPNDIAGNQVSELWLAFASAGYFNTVTNHLVKPIYCREPELKAQGFEVHAEWHKLNSNLQLLQWVTYTEDQTEGWYNGTIITQPAPPPFENGYTRAEYNVTSTTNVGGLLLPNEFSYKEYGIVQTSKTMSHMVLHRVVEGHLASAQPDCLKTRFIPALGAATAIDDRRFSRSLKPILSLAYLVTNENWPKINSTNLLAIYDQAVLQKAFQANHSGAVREPSVGEVHTKRMVVILFICFSLFPLFILLTKAGKLK